MSETAAPARPEDHETGANRFMQYVYQTSGTCSAAIRFSIDGDQIAGVEFLGGCPGNTAAVARLVNGMTVAQIEEKLGGIRCGGKPTSCADQLARAVREAFEKTSDRASDNRSQQPPAPDGNSAYSLTKGPFG